MDRFSEETFDENSPVDLKVVRRRGLVLATVGALLIVLSAFMNTSF
jgi:hypothetical protein